MSAGVRAGAEGHSRPPAVNARQSSSQRHGVTFGWTPDHEQIRGSVCATMPRSGGPRVSRSPPRGAPLPLARSPAPPTRTTHCGPQELWRRWGGGITEPRGFIGSHPPLSGSLTTAGLTGNYFLGEIFWRYLRADFWDFYGCIISGGPAGARLEGPWNRGARRRPPKLPLLSGMEP